MEYYLAMKGNEVPIHRAVTLENNLTMPQKAKHSYPISLQGMCVCVCVCVCVCTQENGKHHIKSHK